MRLLNKKDLNLIPDLYATENIKMKDKIVYAKFFTPDSIFTWYLMELSKQDKDLAFGFVVGLEKEFCYWSMTELESIKGKLGLKVQRDIYFEPTEFKNIK